MKREHFNHDGLRFSYVDAGGEGEIVLALHAHWMSATSFSGLAEALLPDWRLIALDQRGQGHTDHAASYGREDYLGDISAWLDHLGLRGPHAMIGHSLGGVNAYQFAARHPERVKALVIEDIGAEVGPSADFILDWAGFFPTRDALAERLGPRLAFYLAPEFRETPQGWRLAFSPEEIVLSQRALAGDHWADWLASSCPALLVRGANSNITTADHLAEMARRRPNTQLVTLNGGHTVHIDDAEAFSSLVRTFLPRITE